MRDCLTGLRVLDLSQYLPGPYAAQILADLGADVVKVEPPNGDPFRQFGPADAEGLSVFYRTINAGKRVVTLDLKSHAGANQFRALARRADALIESFRPDALARLGFGPQQLRDLNPRLVHCALSGYGQTGPDRLNAGHDINYMALGGGLVASGIPEQPVAAYPPVADFASGQQAALAVLASLLRRTRSGTGAFLDLAIADTVLAWQAMPLTAALYPEFAPRRGASLLNGGAACYRLYEAADGRFVSLGALEAKFWANFCAVAGRPDWQDRQGEPLPQHALIGEVADLFRSKTAAEWEASLAAADCCFQVVAEPHELAGHPQVAARGLLQQSAAPTPLVEVLFPAWCDGKPPCKRPPLVPATIDTVLRAWG